MAGRATAWVRVSTVCRKKWERWLRGSVTECPGQDALLARLRHWVWGDPDCVPRDTGSVGAVHPWFLGNFSGDVRAAPRLCKCSAQLRHGWSPSLLVFLGVGEANVSWCSLGRRTCHSDLRHFGKKTKQTRKANQTWTAAEHFGVEQCVTLTSLKLYFSPGSQSQSSLSVLEGQFLNGDRTLASC